MVNDFDFYGQQTMDISSTVRYGSLTSPFKISIAFLIHFEICVSKQAIRETIEIADRGLRGGGNKGGPFPLDIDKSYPDGETVLR